MVKLWSMKWQLMLYFLASSLLTLGILGFAQLYMPWETAGGGWKFGLAVFAVLLGQAVGFVASRAFQRKVDVLHIAMLQLAKGNLKDRIQIDPIDSFHPVYKSFNEMAGALEERTRLLQEMGEERSVMERGSVETAVVEERRRLARDLHDTVSQELFAIHMSASSLPKVIGHNPDVASQLMEQLIQMSHHAQKQMRGLISQLRPIELDGSTLEQALEKWFPEYCRAHELQGRLDVETEQPISEAIEHQLFLIIQEGMANVVKHASATEIELQLHDSGRQYVLQLADNGKGFERSAISSASHGLSTMRERAQKLGGDAEVLSGSGSGTTVRVRIPKFVKEPKGEALL
ncbi:sensor histidine kinase [Paenibacillus chitinolyticus]|uniref:HAMP domain-containing sensor histidine kinase n=1 Tax=Paenibacillus chitinolyticus TaxID=79263 RepID=UPI002DB87550|nr:sensor histidine kinase [Paenibacillus chitinolyticus]MEC0247841.1 sensor histidine kinase [Paenibacillus chitinolyticus]